ncbi:MAG: alkaline phosphatase [Armatimonadetes bacterium]|nr:alkaline phosphatase [Armatimonadota bacterium]
MTVIRRTIVVVIAILAFHVSPLQAAPAAKGKTGAPVPPPRSVILFIGDGMGEPQRHAARLFKAMNPDDRDEKEPIAVARLTMDGLKASGVMENHSVDNLVTDSAASATAMATGTRVVNRALASLPDGQALKTILERAREQGRSTGLVTTVTVTHATPAAFATHTTDRKKEYDIALDYLNAGVSVLLGGGRMYFLPRGTDDGERIDGRNVAAEMEAKGYVLVKERDALLANSAAPKILGLFDAGGMDYEIDRDPAKSPSLAEMTRVALCSLSTNPRGFFLMVEGGRIDWACHDNDLAAALHDTLALDAAVAEALVFQKSHPNTLILVTNDHETGGLTFPAGFNLAPLVAVRNSIEKVLRGFDRAKMDPNNVAFDDALSERLNLKLDVPGKEKIKLAGGDSKKVLAVLTDMQNARTRVSFSTRAHTGIPSIVSAQGPGQETFTGFYDVTDLCGKMMNVMGLK